MSSVVTDFQNYIRRRSYRPTVSGADQAEKAGELQLLNRVLEMLVASEAQTQLDAAAAAAQSHGRLIREVEGLKLQLEAAQARISGMSRSVQAVHDLRAANQHLSAELNGANDRLVKLSRRYDELERRFQPDKPQPPVLTDFVAEKMLRHRRKPHGPALVERAAVLAGAYFHASPADLQRQVGKGDRIARSFEYKLAKMSFLRSLHSTTAVPFKSLGPDLDLEDKRVDKWIMKHQVLTAEPGFQEKHARVVEELEAFAKELEGMEVAAC